MSVRYCKDRGASEADLFSLQTVDLESERIEWLDVIIETLAFSPGPLEGETLIEATVRIEVGRTT